MTNQHGRNKIRKGMKIMVVAVAAEIHWWWHPPPPTLFPLPCTNQNANPTASSHHPSIDGHL